MPLDGELWDVIERRWTARTVEKKDGTTKMSEFVFHRGGRQVVEFRREWEEACRKAHLNGKIFHDFRRTAVRNMVRAGVQQPVAMSISGHKTVSMFNRYNITSAADKLEALAGRRAPVGATEEEGGRPSDRDARSRGGNPMRTRTKRGQSHQTS